MKSALKEKLKAQESKQISEPISKQLSVIKGKGEGGGSILKDIINLEATVDQVAAATNQSVTV